MLLQPPIMDLIASPRRGLPAAVVGHLSPVPEIEEAGEIQIQANGVAPQHPPFVVSPWMRDAYAEEVLAGSSTARRSPEEVTDPEVRKRPSQSPSSGKRRCAKMFFLFYSQKLDDVDWKLRHF